MSRLQTFGVALLFATAMVVFQIFNRSRGTGVITVGLFDIAQFAIFMLIIYAIAAFTGRRKPR